MKERTRGCGTRTALLWFACAVNGCTSSEGVNALGDGGLASAENPALPLVDAATPRDESSRGGSEPSPVTSEATSPSPGPTTGPNLDLPSEGRGPSILPLPSVDRPTNPPTPASSSPADGSDAGKETSVDEASGLTDAGTPSGESSATGAECTSCPAAADPCHVPRCNPATGNCELVPSGRDVGCDDLDPCTQGDHCDGEGACVGTPRDCSSEDGACTEGVCDPGSGECVASPVRLGEPCDDGNLCTLDDACSEAGICEGETVDCSAFEGSCSVASCNPASGACDVTLLSGVSCDDDDACTHGDVCSDGKCAGKVPETCAASVQFPLAEAERTLLLHTSCNGQALQNDFDVKNVLPPGNNPVKNDCTNSSGPDVFVTLDLTGYTGKVRLFATTDNRDTNFDTVLALLGAASESAAAACNYTTLLACNDAIQVAPVKNERSTVEAELSPGTYVLVVDGYLPKDNGRAALSVQVTPL